MVSRFSEDVTHARRKLIWQLAAVGGNLVINRFTCKRAITLYRVFIQDLIPEALARLWGLFLLPAWSRKD